MMANARSPDLGLAAAVSLVLTLVACDTPVAPEVRETSVAATAGRVADDAVAKPFKARLFTAGEGLTVDPACGLPPRLLNTQVGRGQATHLGRFTVRITFCMDVTDVLDDGLLTDGESLPYDNGVGTLIAANGDQLHMEISGAVVPSTDPAYDLEFRDPFTFTGGTGRFAGASGAARTESFVDQSEDRTDHRWVGTLIVPR